ncbi:MAG: hypothetical protein U1E23_06740 [Reyranellaceae bacterium]
MLLASLLMPIAVALVVFLTQRLRLPAFLALMATVVVYGVAANMKFESIGVAFGQGFATAMEQTGLLVVAGSLVAGLALRAPLGTGSSALFGAVAGLSGAAAGATALLQGAGQDAPRRGLGLALTVLVFSALVAPSPLAVAATSILKADHATTWLVSLPVAMLMAIVGWWHVARQTPRGEVAGRLELGWLAVAAPVALLVVQAIARMPQAPIGGGSLFELYMGLGTPLVVAAVAVTLGVVLAGGWRPSALATRAWAPLLLAVGAAGGLSRVLDETGMATVLADKVLSPRFGLLTPFLVAAVVKTMQGNSLTAVLTASGMVEPLLPGLGLEGPTGRSLAMASVCAGSIAICHLNDPLFWIAAAMGRLTPGRALVVISLGSAAMSLTGLAMLAAVRQFL